jgi:hypothetical protein
MIVVGHFIAGLPAPELNCMCALSTARNKVHDICEMHLEFSVCVNLTVPSSWISLHTDANVPSEYGLHEAGCEVINNMNRDTLWKINRSGQQDLPD